MDHAEPRLLHLLRPQLPVARTGALSFAAAARAGRAVLGAVPERDVPPDPGLARPARTVGGAAGGFRGGGSRTRRDQIDPKHRRILLHLLAGLDAACPGTRTGRRLDYLSRRRLVFL